MEENWRYIAPEHLSTNGVSLCSAQSCGIEMVNCFLTKTDNFKTFGKVLSIL